MKNKLRKTLLSVMATLLYLMIPLSSVSAYGPSVLYASPSNAYEYGALYPRTVQLKYNGAANGTLLATFEKSEANMPSFPIYKSTNSGQTWTQISTVQDTVNGWGNRNGAFLYELPQQIGNMPAGTILCVGLSAPTDKSAERLEVYKSNNQGLTWTYVSRITTSGSYTTTPIWEPFVLVANNKLIVYYSDERSKAQNNQKIVHQTSTNGINWGPVVNDVAPTDVNLRPGMPVVSKMANGQYIMTYEVVNAPSQPNNFKISSNPESWNPTNLGTTIDHGGSPFNVVLPNGRIVYNSMSQTDVLINTNNGVGAWSPLKTNLEAGYSRFIQPVSGTGRVLLMSCPGFWLGPNVKNTIRYADVDLGYSTGAYFKLVNRNSGKVLGIPGSAFTDGASAVQWTDVAAADQAWHVIDLGNGYRTISNRNSGRALGVSQGGTADGASAVQWVDTQANDQQWQLVAAGAYYKIKNRNSGKLLGVLGGSTADGAQVVQWTDTGSLDQQWTLVQVSP